MANRCRSICKGDCDEEIHECPKGPERQPAVFTPLSCLVPLDRPLDGFSAKARNVIVLCLGTIAVTGRNVIAVTLSVRTRSKAVFYRTQEISRYLYRKFRRHSGTKERRSGGAAPGSVFAGGIVWRS